MRMLTYLDLAQNELRNAVIQNLSAAPSAPKAGQTYYNTTVNIEFFWNGTAWRPKDAAALTDGSIQIAAIGAFKSTILNYTLDTFAPPVAPVNFNAQRATALANATASTDAVPLAQMQSAITAAINGQTSIKPPVRVYAAGTLTLSGTQTVDSVTLNVGDRVLAANQATASQNGIYVVASGAWSLAGDANATSEWLEGSEILVNEGSTYGGAIFSQTTQAPTLTTLTFVQRNKINAYLADGMTTKLTGFTFSVPLVSGGGLVASASGVSVDTTVVARKFAFAIAGTGSATSFPITHNLGTQAINSAFQDASNNGVILDWVATSANVMTVTFGTAPASGTNFSGVVVG